MNRRDDCAAHCSHTGFPADEGTFRERIQGKSLMLLNGFEYDNGCMKRSESMYESTPIGRSMRFVGADKIRPELTAT